MASYQGFYAKFVPMISPKCSIVEKDGEIMLMALHVRFGFAFTRCGLSIRMPLSFVFHNITNIRIWRCFSSFKIHTEHILQHYQDFQSNVAIFPSFVQAYTQPYSFSGRITPNICQIRHECYHSRNKCKFKKRWMADPIYFRM